MLLLLTAKADADAADSVSDSPRSVVELCRVLSCVVYRGRRPSAPRYTVLLRMDTVGQCSYYSLRRPILMLRTGSVTCLLYCVGIVQSTELCGGLGPQSKWTPLHRAAQNGRNESMQLLLTAKVDANAANTVSDSPTVM